MTALISLLQSIVVLVSAVSIAQLVRGMFYLSLLTGFVMFFRPLLVGIARALVLTVRPRRPKNLLHGTASGT
ncbi:hypothetical protein [Massilia horti]|uniref:Uncharacterized protein n=1 Tax=Massilia horti TaxID=2562153 RepID=A0A4Y9SQ33_9BURK|nr:hypothetical protein [Massilia horti]TFW27459.1 hypothetical protein E4O92_23960 [Massilia horti]